MVMSNCKYRQKIIGVIFSSNSQGGFNGKDGDTLNKKFIIEQCRRIEVIHQEESNELKEELNSKWMLIHNDGHRKIMDYFISFLNSVDSIDKRAAKKWLKKAKKKSNNIIKNLDERYNHFSNDEVMNQEDERIYYMNDGAICIAYTLIDIINKKRYISKIKQFWIGKYTLKFCNNEKS